jgi:hypothetical protein
VPRLCTVCQHPEREAADRALVAGEALRGISVRLAMSRNALHRHKREHIPALLARAREREQEHADQLQAQQVVAEVREDAHALDVMAELRRCFERVNLLFDACDRWLRDPEDPARYDVGPRADDVTVIYSELGPGGSPVQRKAKLSRLLARLEEAGIDVQRGETRHADPRELILRTAAQLQGQVELLAKLLGELDERPQVNVLLGDEWLSVRGTLLGALQPYPEARAAVAASLLALGEGRSNGHR